jgi:hypothetical protein
LFSGRDEDAFHAQNAGLDLVDERFAIRHAQLLWLPIDSKELRQPLLPVVGVRVAVRVHRTAATRF